MKLDRNSNLVDDFLCVLQILHYLGYLEELIIKFK